MSRAHADSSRRCGALVAAVALAPAVLAGCGISTTASDGPTSTVCGQTIASAMVGPHPWFVDVTTTHDVVIQVHDRVWVQLSHDCRGGATVTGIDPGVASIAARVGSGRPDAPAAIDLLGAGPGVAVLEVTQVDGSTTPLHVTVEP